VAGFARSPSHPEIARIMSPSAVRLVVHSGGRKPSPAFSKTPYFAGFSGYPRSTVGNPSLSAKQSSQTSDLAAASERMLRLVPKSVPKACRYAA
jgi:hypothetical protein